MKRSSQAVEPAAGTAERRAPGPCPPSKFPNRTFESLIFDWDGTAVPDRSADASAVRARIEALCAAGADIVIVSGTNVDNVDRQLAARPSGPGRLFLGLNRGSEMFRADTNGVRLVWRREATEEENEALDKAAALTVHALADVGITAEIVSARLNRRKVDLIPVKEWADPPKARIGELLHAVSSLLTVRGLSGLTEVVDIAMRAAHEAGLADPRVTSDVKHVEIGITDKSDSIRWMLEHLSLRGVGPGLVLIGGDEFGPLGGVTGSDSKMLVPEASRAIAVSVGVEPEGTPARVQRLSGGPESFLALLDDQLSRRSMRRVPWVDEDPAWSLVLDGGDGRMRRVHETLLALSDGRFGTRRFREEGDSSDPMLLAAGVYEMQGKDHVLLPGPQWAVIDVAGSVDEGSARRILDLRTGVVAREASLEEGCFRIMRFMSVARPGTMAMRAEGPRGELRGTRPLEAPLGEVTFEEGIDGDVGWARTTSGLGGGIAAAVSDHTAVAGELSAVERIAAYAADPLRPPTAGGVIARLGEVEAVGFDHLLAEHRAAWASRWEGADVRIDGDRDAQLMARFALFHVLSSARPEGELAVGARGLSGWAYSGHVFWDTDVYVLPVLAATDPEAARAVLEYRVRRLAAARQAASARGHAGARFPWESAATGFDVTPRVVRDARGILVPIRTGEHEEHIVADVAWAAWHYVQWTGDTEFLAGPGRALITETARYWASRARNDSRGRAHIYGVIGPDEYHEPVDDNAYTNVMARWNLRCAADLVSSDGKGGTEQDVTTWRRIADELVDGYNPATGLYEQFAGFWSLEPLVISEQGDPPIAADVLLGRERVAGSQILKQPDVLMLHHLVPEEVHPGSLQPNLSYYGPRTAHGSSLSPAIHAGLMARAEQPDRALPFFRIASRLDVDDLTGTTAGGLHLATLGGVWQALAFGFLGIRPGEGMLRIDPQLPETWDRLEMRMRLHGAKVRICAERDQVMVVSDRPLRVSVSGGRPTMVTPPGSVFVRPRVGWKQKPLEGTP